MSYTKTQIGAFFTVLAAGITCWFSFDQSSTGSRALNGLGVILLCVSPVLGALRDRRSASASSDQETLEYEGPADVTSAMLLGLSLLSLALVVVFPVRWPAAVAFGLSYSLLTLSLSKKSPLKNLFVALFATLSLWPLAPELAHRVESRTELYLSRLVGDRLDSIDVLNYPEGRTIQTVKGSLEVGLPDGRLAGLRLGTMLGCVVGILMRRGPFHLIALSAAGWYWAVVMNGFWAFGRILSLNGIGTWKTLWGNSLIACLVGLVLILSTDQLLLVFSLFNPLTWIKRDKKRQQAAPESAEALGDESAAELEEELPPTELPSPVFLGLGAASLVIAFLAAAQSIQHLREIVKVQALWKSAAAKKETSLWPDRLGRWARNNANLTAKAPSVDDPFSKSAVSANFVVDDKVARVSWIGPYSGWNDRFLDYQLKGWSLGPAQVVSSAANTKPFLMVQLTQPTGEKGFLVYAMQNISGEEVPATLRSLSRTVWWHLLQSLFLRNSAKPDLYMTEVFIESYATPKEDELRSRDELVRAALATALPKSLQGK